jgi:biopolymer transport protein TolR
VAGFDDRPSGGAIAQINVTPLVDVMLVLLVIFMVTAPIIQQGIAVNLPQVQAGALTGEDTQLVVSITKEGKLYLNDVEMTAAELDRKLVAIVAAARDKQVFIRADGAVPYGEVMRAMGAVRGAGVQRIGMVTEPPVED